MLQPGVPSPPHSRKRSPPWRCAAALRAIPLSRSHDLAASFPTPEIQTHAIRLSIHMERSASEHAVGGRETPTKIPHTFPRSGKWLGSEYTIHQLCMIGHIFGGRGRRHVISLHPMGKLPRGRCLLVVLLLKVKSVTQAKKAKKRIHSSACRSYRPSLPTD